MAEPLRPFYSFVIWVCCCPTLGTRRSVCSCATLLRGGGILCTWINIIFIMHIACKHLQYCSLQVVWFDGAFKRNCSVQFQLQAYLSSVQCVEAIA